MQALEGILREHAARYPKMEPTDAVKLIYQNEFAGGHMIRDPESCLAYLQREYSITHHDDTKPLLEDIGNGIVRVHLAALPEEQIQALGQAFICTAQGWQGSVPRFQQKLTLLRKLCQEGLFSFEISMLDDYLAAYAAAGYPAVSHSDAYRTAYSPAYRIVSKDALLRK
ncbi:MAG: hypothetical protein IKY59_04240 [Oscillospiraceae bacterium]|nr:hypothetical protein [Oscillospiraceae bacterium]